MGEQLCGNLVMVTNDGREVKFENAEILKENLVMSNEVSGVWDELTRATGEVELELTVGNISKKRFVKLLMGKGMQRNEATEMAKYIIRKYGYYNPMQLIMF